MEIRGEPMKGDDPSPQNLFDEEARLRLLQLLTRRSMAERRAKTAATRLSVVEGDATEDALGAELQLPKRWRLVPEGVALHEWQRECLSLWLADGRGTVKVATGGGKTLFALAAGQELQNEREPDLRLVVVVPTIPLMFQWRDEVLRGNLPPAAIGLMGGAQGLPPLEGIRVLICVLNSAREKLVGLVRRADWSRRMLLVVDECHRSAAEQASQIFETKPRFTLGLSATPEPNTDDESLPSDDAFKQGVVGQALGPIIYDFSLARSLEAGLLTPFEVWHVGLSLNPREAAEHARLSREITDLRKVLQRRHSSSRSKQGFLAWCQAAASRGGSSAAEAERFLSLASRRKRLLYRAKARTEAALGILAESLPDVESRAILFHESIEEIEALFLEALSRQMPAVLEHSLLPDSLRAENIEAFRKGAARIIISAKSLVEGFNVPSADVGVIAASAGVVRQRIQTLGRMLRRKVGGRTARVFVLYVRDTEDEAIYEKADWESVIGAERNRYFVWNLDPESRPWPAGLDETAVAPRIYRPPSSDVDPSILTVGDPYPGQPQGRDLRVDQGENLRLEDETIIPVQPVLIAGILQHSPHRRARVTPAGHLIARADLPGSGEADWRFIGVINEVPEPDSGASIRLKIMTTAGRRVIARAEGQQKHVIPFALGPDKSSTREAGEARDRLLEWLRQEETRLGLQIRDLYWDGKASYWIEAKGNRVPYPELLVQLEFGS